MTEPVHVIKFSVSDVNLWKEAVLDALANSGMDADVDTPPADIVKMLIAFNVDVAKHLPELLE